MLLLNFPRRWTFIRGWNPGFSARLSLRNTQMLNLMVYPKVLFHPIFCINDRIGTSGLLDADSHVASTPMTIWAHCASQSWSVCTTGSAFDVAAYSNLPCDSFSSGMSTSSRRASFWMTNSSWGSTRETTVPGLQDSSHANFRWNLVLGIVCAHAQ